MADLLPYKDTKFFNEILYFIMLYTGDFLLRYYVRFSQISSHIYSCMHNCVCSYIYMCTSIHTCVYISYVCMHACMHVHIIVYTNVSSLKPGQRHYPDDPLAWIVVLKIN